LDYSNANFRRGGSLKVVTTRLKPGCYCKNGMPYSGNAVFTGYFRDFQLPELPDGSMWNPSPCSVK